MATQDHRFLRRHRQRPRRAGARPPARLLRRRALARLRPPLPGRGARGEGGRGAARPRRRLGRRPGHAPPRRRQPRHQRRPDRAGRARERRRDRLRLRVPHRARHGQARASRPTNCCSAARRRSPSPRPACATTRRSASTRSASSTRATRPPGQTADSLAAALGARSPSTARGPVDLLVVGSRPESPAGQGHPQRRQRLRGRGRDLPGAGRAARRRAQLRGAVPALRTRLTTRITAATSGSRPSIRSRASAHSSGAGSPPGACQGARRPIAPRPRRRAARARGPPPPEHPLGHVLGGARTAFDQP